MSCSSRLRSVRRPSCMSADRLTAGDPKKICREKIRHACVRAIDQRCHPSSLCRLGSLQSPAFTTPDWLGGNARDEGSIDISHCRMVTKTIWQSLMSPSHLPPNFPPPTTIRLRWHRRPFILSADAASGPPCPPCRRTGRGSFPASKIPATPCTIPRGTSPSALRRTGSCRRCWPTG